MTSPILVPTSQPTLQLASSWRLRVNTAYDQTLTTQPAPVWAMVYDLIDFTPGSPEYDKIDTTTYDNADPVTGVVSKSQRKVGQSQTVAGQRVRNVYPVSADNVGWKTIAAAAAANKLVHINWFNVDPSGESWQGFADPTYSPQGGGPADKGVDQISLELQGARTALANPMASATLPNATTATPATGPAGTTVVLTGTALAGVTAIKFGTTAAVVIPGSSTSVSTVVPAAASTGSQPITVTNAVGDDTTTVAFSKT